MDNIYLLDKVFCDVLYQVLFKVVNLRPNSPASNLRKNIWKLRSKLDAGLFGLERVVTADLQHLIKSKAATIAQLNSRLTATAGGKTLEASIAELRERLATAEAVARASNEEWAKERQQLQDEVARIKRDELRTRASLEAANQTIDLAQEEDEEYKKWMLRKSRDSQDHGRGRETTNPSSSIQRLSSRSMVEESTPVRGQPERRASAGKQRGLGSDVQSMLLTGRP